MSTIYSAPCSQLTFKNKEERIRCLRAETRAETRAEMRSSYLWGVPRTNTKWMVGILTVPDDASLKEREINLRAINRRLRNLSRKKRKMINKRQDVLMFIKNQLIQLRIKAPTPLEQHQIRLRLTNARQQADALEKGVKKLNLMIERFNAARKEQMQQIEEIQMGRKEEAPIVTEDEGTPAVIPEPDSTAPADTPTEPDSGETPDAIPPKKDLMVWVKENVIFIIIGVIALVLFLKFRK